MKAQRGRPLKARAAQRKRRKFAEVDDYAYLVDTVHKDDHDHLPYRVLRIEVDEGEKFILAIRAKVLKCWTVL